MNIEEAYRFLSLTSDSTENERYAKYEDIRNKLESKLAKAPTPGLKEKYRESVRHMEAAIEVIEGSLDGGDLPTLTPQHEKRPEPTPAVAPEPRAESAPRSKPVARKSKSSELGVIAAVVIVIIAGGAWFWQNQAAEKAEQAAVENFMLNVSRGRTEAVEIALSSSLPLDLNLTDEENSTALMIAVRQGHVDIVELLLADPGVTVNRPFSPAKHAINLDDSKMSEAVLRNPRVRIDGVGALASAIYNDNYDAMRIILSRPDVDIHETDMHGYTALHHAAEQSDVRFLQILLSHPDVDVNRTAHLNGYSALIVATEGFGTADLPRNVQLLLLHPEIDVNITAHYGATALSKAARNGKIQSVQLLLAHPKIDVNPKEYFDETVIEQVINRSSRDDETDQEKQNYAEIVRLLRAAGSRE